MSAYYLSSQNLGDEGKPMSNFLGGRWLLLLTFRVKRGYVFRGHNRTCWLWRGWSRWWLEMGLSHLEENILHTTVVRLEFLDGFFDSRNKWFLAVSRHFCVHTVAFPTKVPGKEARQMAIELDGVTVKFMYESIITHDNSLLTVIPPIDLELIASEILIRRYTHHSSS